jgi:hypothetical protein
MTCDGSAQREQRLLCLGFECCFEVRVDVENLDELTDLEPLHYRFWDVAELEDAIRFEQSTMQGNQEHMEGPRKTWDVYHVPKIKNDQGMVIIIDESEQFCADILSWISVPQKAIGMPESHDGSCPDHSNFDMG